MAIKYKAKVVAAVKMIAWVTDGDKEVQEIIEVEEVQDFTVLYRIGKG
jgi:hypothetical protein